MAKDKGNKTEKAILDYLMAQNRPFAVNDLLQSAHLKEYGKSAIQKSLDQLVVAGKVNEKTYGKAKVFVVNQDLVSSPNGANVAEMDSRILELTRQIAEDEDFLKKTESELKVLNSSLSIEEIKDQLKSLLEENEKLSQKLSELSENKVKVSATDFKKVKASKEKGVSELRKRKRICGDMIDQILEGYPKPKKALLEEVGIVPD